jgi:hypothetical protein
MATPDVAARDATPAPDETWLSLLERLNRQSVTKHFNAYTDVDWDSPDMALGGEDPIDYVQRRELRSRRELHPLLERIMRIHVTEEARHLSFARCYLKRTVPALSPLRRTRLAVAAPVILGQMAELMLKPSPQLIARYRIPKAVIAEGYRRNPRHRAETAASLAKVRRLCADLGLTRSPYGVLWKLVGLDSRA